MIRTTERGAWPRCPGAARLKAPEFLGNRPSKFFSRIVAIRSTRRTFPATARMYRPPAGLERGPA